MSVSIHIEQKGGGRRQTGYSTTSITFSVVSVVAKKSGKCVVCEKQA